MIKKILTERNITIIFIFISILLGAYLEWSLKDIVLFCFIMYLVLNPWKSRDMAKLTLFFLILTPICIFGKRELYAIEFSIIAFYFFSLMVLTTIFELRGKRNRDEIEIQ